MTTLKKYGINIDPKTMQYYYAANNFHYKDIYNEHCQEATTNDTVNQSTREPLYETPNVLNLLSDAPAGEPVHETAPNQPEESYYGDDEANEAFELVDSDQLIHSINAYHQKLFTLNLVAAHSLTLIQDLKTNPEILAIKGCGAFGCFI
jgi:hypothetical protein